MKFEKKGNVMNVGQHRKDVIPIGHNAKERYEFGSSQGWNELCYVQPMKIKKM
jgi:hypothetical protein